MKAEEVAELLGLFEQNGIEVWIDGGWGVDALLGRQTRPHEDLDIALRHRDVPLLRRLLEERGYIDVPRDDTRDCNFVLGDGHRLVDIHSFTFDAEGNLIQGVDYPPQSLSGEGTIAGKAVKCIEPAWMVKFHCGYKLDENDYHDVKALCDHFGFTLPEELLPFETTL